MDLKEYIEIAYTLVILVLCFYIYFKTRKLYKLSQHEGIKSFKNTFLFFGLTFIVRYFYINITNGIYGILIALVFNYLISMAGFYLVYSLVWKNFAEKREYLLHLLALIISALTVFVNPYLMFVTLIVLLLYAILLSYNNYRNSPNNNFLQLYFISITLAFLSYLINFISLFYEPVAIYAKAITVTAFLIFTIGVIRTLSWPKKESA